MMNEDFANIMREVQDVLAKEKGFTFEYKEIGRALEEIPQAITERIVRNADGVYAVLRSRHGALPEVVDFSMRVSANTWATILYLCGDKTHHGRRIEFIASVPPLSRTLLDTLMTFVYIFDDAGERCRRYFVSGWGKGMIHYERMRAKYGSDPRWEPWLRGFLKSTESYLESAIPTEAEKIDLKVAGRWPNPGRMARLCKDPKRKAFLELLNAMFYNPLSEDSHLALPGLARRSALLQREKEMNGMPEVNPQHYRTITFIAAQTIYVAFLSEVAGELGLSHEKERLRMVWAKITSNPNWDDTIALYETRYEELLR